MSIGLTTVVLFAVFGILLFLSCPISVSIIIASIVTAVSSLSWDRSRLLLLSKPRKSPFFHALLFFRFLYTIPERS